MSARVEDCVTRPHFLAVRTRIWAVGDRGRRGYDGPQDHSKRADRMGIRAYLFKCLQDIRASYWFLPSVLVLVGLGLAALMGWVDRHPERMPFPVPERWRDTQADGARSTLAVIAQSIIGVTGVTFSMTLVAVSFASGNFGPRLIGNFMRDRGTQWSLGILIASFVYALMVLRGVQDGTDGAIAQFVPHYGLFLALVLTLVCVATLIYFIHHVPETINVSRISARIGAALDHQIRCLIDDNTPKSPSEDVPQFPPDQILCAGDSGYLQTVNFTQIQQFAEKNGWYVNLPQQIGAFVTLRTPVLEVWTAGAAQDVEELRKCYAIGAARTEHQNPSFLAEQLVEMVARALSPGVNDPYTAMDCLNRLAASLAVASCYGDGLKDRRLERVGFRALTFERLFAVTFPLCRSYIQGDRLVLAHTRAILADLVTQVRAQDRPYLRAELDALSKD